MDLYQPTSLNLTCPYIQNPVNRPISLPVPLDMPRLTAALVLLALPNQTVQGLGS
jgi:hypothetical protein